MANLTETAQKLKKLLPFLVFIALILLFLGAAYLRLNKKTQNQTPPNAQISPPTININPLQKQAEAYDFSQAQIPNVPEKLPVFSIEKIPLNDSVAKGVASSFDITNNPLFVDENTQDGKLYSWKQDSADLALSESKLDYKKQSPQKGASLSEKDLQNVASAFIQKIPLLDKSLAFDPGKTRYLILDKSGPAPINSFRDSQFVEFHFQKELANLPLLGASPNLTQETIRASKYGEISYLSARFFNLSSPQNYQSLKTANEAIGEIIKSQGKIVLTVLLDKNGQPGGLYSFDPQDLKSVIVKNMYLAYLLPQNLSELIQPIYVFEGFFQKSPEEKVAVTIYLPAIKTSPSLKP